MNTYVKMGIAAALMMGVGAAVIIKNGGTCSTCRPWPILYTPSVADEADYENPSGLPRLVELGSTTCIPCKMMKPVIEELTAEYAGRLDVIFIDVMKDADEAEKYNIEVIPTQVFLDASGKELFRHVGVISKEDILAKWAEFGFEFTETSTLAQ